MGQDPWEQTVPDDQRTFAEFGDSAYYVIKDVEMEMGDGSPLPAEFASTKEELLGWGLSEDEIEPLAESSIEIDTPTQ